MDYVTLWLQSYGAHDLVYIFWPEHLIALCQITGFWH